MLLQLSDSHYLNPGSISRVVVAPLPDCWKHEEKWDGTDYPPDERVTCAVILYHGGEHTRIICSDGQAELVVKRLNEALKNVLPGGMKTDDSLQKSFTYHPPKPGQPERYASIRSKALEFANLISGECPESRERSIAMTNLEEAVMWANAAIARNE